jgi:hypothetical protein
MVTADYRQALQASPIPSGQVLQRKASAGRVTSIREHTVGSGNRAGTIRTHTNCSTIEGVRFL